MNRAYDSAGLESAGITDLLVSIASRACYSSGGTFDDRIGTLEFFVSTPHAVSLASYQSWAGHLASFTFAKPESKRRIRTHAPGLASLTPAAVGEIFMGSKLYVGNLSYEVANATLNKVFEPHGTVSSAEVIQDRETGRSKGFGFVQMGSDAEAQAAIAALNGEDKPGRG